MYYDTIALGLIMAKPMYGYEIKTCLKQFNRNINGAEISNNTIYPLLAKYERKGITTKQVVAQKGKPNKVLYSITEEGRQFFFESLNTISRSVVTSQEEFCMRLLFFSVITPANRKKLLEERESFLRAALPTEESPIGDLPMIDYIYNKDIVLESLMPFYMTILTKELEVIEYYKQRIDDPCLIPEDILAKLF